MSLKPTTSVALFLMFLLVAQTTSLAIDSNDNLHVTYLDDYPNYNLEYMTFSNSAGGNNTGGSGSGGLALVLAALGLVGARVRRRR